MEAQDSSSRHGNGTADIFAPKRVHPARLVLINFELHAADFTLPTYSILLLHTK